MWTADKKDVSESPVCNPGSVVGIADPWNADCLPSFAKRYTHTLYQRMDNSSGFMGMRRRSYSYGTSAMYVG